MKIGKVIRKYRKEMGITQEEMAKRLGVTAPAVNKWENDNSTPDISLLAPIARMFRISVDELLSFKEDLTEEEIRQYIIELDEMWKEHSYEEVFCWGKSLLEEYPHCEKLLWQIAVILDANRLFRQVENSEQYDSFIVDWYHRAMESADESVRYNAANSLFSYYIRKENYEGAENCLNYFSSQNPERKRMRADLAWKQGQKEEAYKAQEELIFSEFQMLQRGLQALYLMALEDNDLKKAAYLIKKQKEVAVASDFGKYHEDSYGLELLIKEKDVEGTLDWMNNVLGNVEKIWGFTESPLYEHMTFKKADDQFIKEMVHNLKTSIADEETFGYLSGDERWEKLKQ